MTIEFAKRSQMLREELALEILRLPPATQIAYLCCCCERLAPNYRPFCLDEKMGDDKLLDRALDQLWAIARQEKYSKAMLRSLIQAIEESPLDEDRTSSFLSFAIDATSAVMLTLEFVLNDSAEHIQNVLRFCDETVSEWILVTCRLDPTEAGEESRNARSLEELREAQKVYDTWRFEHPMARDERRLKSDQLLELRSIELANDQTWADLRKRASSYGIQPFIRRIGPVR